MRASVEMQQDLFDSNWERQPAKIAVSEASILEKHFISLRFDQTIIGVIALLVLFAFVFSVGFEKGKKVAQTVNLMGEHTVKNATVEAVTAPLPVTGSITMKAVEVTPGVLSKPDRPISIQEVSASEKNEPETLRPAGKFTIQIITYTSQKAVEETIKKLATLGHSGFVIPSGKYLQVCADAFNSFDQAREGLRQMKAQGAVPPDAYIRPIVR
jgi:hypothetical protein